MFLPTAMVDGAARMRTYNTRKERFADGAAILRVLAVTVADARCVMLASFLHCSHTCYRMTSERTAAFSIAAVRAASTMAREHGRRHTRTHLRCVFPFASGESTPPK